MGNPLLQGPANAIEELWLIHPEAAACEAFAARFDGLPRFRIFQERFDALAPHDCFVTAGNAFGIMNAGIDAAVVAYFGESLMYKVQHRILEEFLGEQPIGTAFVIETGHADKPFLVHAPTMRVPGPIDGTDKVYTATWAALLAVNAHNQTSRRTIRTLAMPAMGTGFGRMPFDEAARQMATAYRHYWQLPHRFEWDGVLRRERAIACDGAKQVVR
jgi:O-acetyl-ADP-ribose deacetylase (regulator of RNase III)